MKNTMFHSSRECALIPELVLATTFHGSPMNLHDVKLSPSPGMCYEITITLKRVAELLTAKAVDTPLLTSSEEWHEATVNQKNTQAQVPGI